MAESMRAIVIENPGPAFRLGLQRVGRPIPREGEVLIRVAYTGLNRADLMQAQGKYPPPVGAPPYPGLEVSGHIEALGKGVSSLSIGDTVCALIEGGGYAEYVCANAGQVMPVPDGIDLRDAAILPEAFATTWLTMIELGKLKAGETFLVHGGASGIGIAAIQLAKWRGAKTVTTAGSDEKCAFALSVGAERAVNYTNEDFGESCKEQVDLILDMTGGDNIAKNFNALKKGGRLVSIAFLRGAKSELFLGPLLTKHITWIGSTLRSRTPKEKADICKALQKNLWPAIADGRLKTVIDSEFPLGEAEKALSRMQQNLNLGKIVLKVAGSQ